MAKSRRWVYVMPWQFFGFAQRARNQPAQKIQACLSPAAIDQITEALLAPAARYGEMSDPNLIQQLQELFKGNVCSQSFLERMNRWRQHKLKTVSAAVIPEDPGIHLDMLRKKAFLMTRELLAHHPLEPLDGVDAGNVGTTYRALGWFVEKNGGRWILDEDTTNWLLEGFMDQQVSDDQLENWMNEHIELAAHDDFDDYYY
jgi:hypothetical protein